MRPAEPLIPVKTTETVAVLGLNDIAVRNRRFRAFLRLRAALEGGER